MGKQITVQQENKRNIAERLWCHSCQWDGAECHKKLTDQKLATIENRKPIA